MMSFSNYFNDDDEVVELSFSAQVFVRKATTYVQVTSSDSNEVFKTEMVINSQKPKFNATYKITPNLTRQQILTVSLHENFGEAKIALGRILVSNGVVVTLNGANAEVTITVSQEKKGRAVLSMIVAFYNLPKNHWLMKNYPELHICKKDDASGEWISVFKSDVMKNQDAGQWDPISIPCKSVCGENYNKKIRLYVYNDQKETLQDKREVVKNFYKIGYAEATVNQIQSMRNEILTLKPCNPKVARAGNLIIRSASLFEKLTFFGQIMKGLRFNLACAISFASSNRPPRDSKSLHYTPFGQSNAYQATMGVIGGAIEPYSDGRPFHAWGLAAKYNRILSHCFPLTINGNKDLAGLRDLQNAYYGIFENIVFDKPVSIVPSTRQAISLVAGSKNPADYLVFVIMVNEVPVDLDEFIDLLYDNQMEPISVVVVGIGDDEFKEMGTKLSPGMLKNSKEMVFDRDVALFIKFNDYGMQALDQFMSTALITVTDQAVHWVDVNVNFV